MHRPALIATLSSNEFLRWYWLKAELAAFCRDHGLRTTGSKLELAHRIESYLSERDQPAAVPRARRTVAMPKQFDRSSVIGEGWRCTQALRAFFETEVGRGFHFNRALRTFIATEHGRTLADALEHFAQSLQAEPQPIAAQFEYNRHVRAFHLANPGAARADAIAAWWAKRERGDGMNDTHDVQIVVSPPHFSDWPTLLQLLHSAYAYMASRIDPPSSLLGMNVQQLQNKAHDESLILAYQDQRLVGCAFASLVVNGLDGADCVYVGKLAVDAAVRGQGIARKIMQTAENIAHANARRFLELETRIELTENHQTFAALGFAKVAETAHPCFDRPTSIRMRKQVSV